MRILILASSLVLAVHASFAAGLKPAALRTEWLINPLGIDAAQPRLSWRLESDTRGQNRPLIKSASRAPKTLSSAVRRMRGIPVRSRAMRR